MENRIGIYVHVPFCKAKCNYCDFNSYSGRESLAGSYFDALFSEMKHRAVGLEGRPVRSVFIGGGTPTLVDPTYISGLLELCSKLFKLEPDAEISLESNPGTLSYESLKSYRAAGVNRLSIGLQAWQDRLLKELGRIHDRGQFEDNFSAAVEAGFQNINVDLIFGLPGQTFEEWAETLEAVTELGKKAASEPGKDVVRELGEGMAAGPEGDPLTHLSCYSLKIEEGTVFGDRYDAGTLKPAEDELDRRMYRHAVEYLAGRGFRQYEISNFARPGRECRHNLIYWKAEEYAGFGAGAHSYLNGMRFSNTAGIEQYIGAVKRIGENVPSGQSLQLDMQFIDKHEAMAEFMILGLRLNEGIRAAEFRTRFGEGLEAVYGSKLQKLVKAGLLQREAEDRFVLTPLGLDVSNQVFIEFI
jgi:oxygen-independent coproporphyrinogen-3 oxidase